MQKSHTTAYSNGRDIVRIVAGGSARIGGRLGCQPLWPLLSLGSRVGQANDLDNEFNPGLGVRHSMGSWLKADAIIDAGAYYDSGRNTAVYAGAGLLWPLDKDKRFNLGAVLTAFHSDTYNHGDPFIAPLPLFSLRLDGVTLNLTHFPKIRNFNEVAATAMFITIPLH